MSVSAPALLARMLGQCLIVCGVVFGLGFSGLVPHSWLVGPSTFLPHALEQMFGLIGWYEVKMGTC